MYQRCTRDCGGAGADREIAHASSGEGMSVAHAHAQPLKSGLGLKGMSMRLNLCCDKDSPNKTLTSIFLKRLFYWGH